MRFLDTSRIRTRFDERVRAADGTELSVDLYLPPEPGSYPILLNRTASDNKRSGCPGISLPPAERWKAFAAQGYIVAAADVRGRGDSDGKFVPFVAEGADGAATIAWLRTLKECNGKIGLFGSGYGGFCAWAAAVADGRADAIASISAFGAVGEGLVHRGGAVRLDWLFWMHLIGGRTVHGGAPQQLIVGLWDTAGVRRPVAQTGGFDFGPRSVIDMDETLVEFFNDSFSTSETASATRSRVLVTGRNEWADCESWPATAQSTLTLHFGSNLGANTRRGDGTLSSTPPAQKSTDVVTHNPAVPVDFQPQFVSFATGANPLGLTLDQSHLTARDEALVYTSEPLQRTVTVQGRPKLILTVRTTAADTDLYVLLSDSFPLGIGDLHLGHTAVRLATVKSFKPLEQVKVDLALDPLAHDFYPGHQIRLTVTPSFFPLYARNLHTAQYASGQEPLIADIELHHGPDRVGILMLPLARMGET